MKKRTLALLLTLLMIAPSVISCSESSENAAEETQASAEAASVEETPAEEEPEADARLECKVPADVTFGGETVGVIFPILSRNRFAICLRGIAKGAKKVVIMLSYPSDEVGNHLISLDAVDEKGVNPYTDVLTEAKYREYFGGGGVYPFPRFPAPHRGPGPGQRPGRLCR